MRSAQKEGLLAKETHENVIRIAPADLLTDHGGWAIGNPGCAANP